VDYTKEIKHHDLYHKGGWLSASQVAPSGRDIDMVYIAVPLRGHFNPKLIRIFRFMI